MKIVNHTAAGAGPSSLPIVNNVLPLNERMGLEKREAQGVKEANPEFDKFYDDFMMWLEDAPTHSVADIQEFLKQYTGADGEFSYRTIEKQMGALTEIMIRMKDQGQQNSTTYKEVMAAFMSCSMSNMFIQEFMQDVFKPSEDEEGRENSSW
ncbi:hypothetical protein PflCFBP13517_25700 [Pseudomonas fluorescens]|nr:hypothetical protein PflCFBP13517_25700 [Pseudomonas fluorescens]